MKKSFLFSLLFAFLLFPGLFSEDKGPRDVRIKEILEFPYEFAMQTVRLAGKVVMVSDEVKTATTRSYILQDDWGDAIKVSTNKTILPEVGRRYLVTVIVIADKEKSENKIIESTRQISPGDQQGDITNVPTTASKKNNFMSALFGIIAIIILIIAVWIFLRISAKYKNSITSEFSSFPSASPEGLNTVPSEYPEPAEFIEDNTIKMSAPPEGTLKLLPGRLEIAGGYDKVKEIRFYKLPNQKETEFTFGRSSGAPYVYIQVKSPTVSLKQAKIIWANGRYMLHNYSTTNPTIVDGKDLAKDELVPLKEGSKIEMGEISFIFHEK